MGFYPKLPNDIRHGLLPSQCKLIQDRWWYSHRSHNSHLTSPHDDANPNKTQPIFLIFVMRYIDGKKDEEEKEKNPLKKKSMCPTCFGW